MGMNGLRRRASRKFRKMGIKWSETSIAHSKNNRLDV
jgi:hypothetical protein